MSVTVKIIRNAQFPLFIYAEDRYPPYVTSTLNSNRGAWLMAKWITDLKNRGLDIGQLF